MWVGRFEAGHSRNGNRRRIVVYATTEAACKQKLEERKREVALTGPPRQLTGQRVTVEAWSQSWLAMVLHDMRPKSYATTASAIKVWIVPTIGHKRLDTLSPADVRTVVDALRKAGRKGSTRVRAHSVLMSMLKAASVEGHYVPERIFHARKPTLNESDRDALSVDDALAILRVAQDMPDATRWMAVLLQGLRQGERLGLTWSCIDFERDVINVSWQLQPLPYIDRADKARGFRVPDGYTARHLVQAFHLVRPKSKNSRRQIPMTSAIRVALKAWREVAPANDYELVWPTPDGLPVREESDRTEWKEIQNLADVRHPSGRYYVLHEGRHTTATLLLELGADKDVVGAILGHSRFIQSYDHSDRSDEVRAALNLLADRLAPKALAAAPD